MELLKIAAAYIRVSDERQDEYSPDSQLKKAREQALRDGYTIPDEYVFYDDGISGKSVSKRDDFNNMIAMAKDKAHPFERIYVWKFSRFARNQEESIVYKNLLRKFDVSVVSVSEAIPDGPFGSLIERIIEWMDEFYLINLGTEVRRGMAEKISRGEPICYPAIGYVIKDKKYYPDEEGGGAALVREMFQRYADGQGERYIAIALQDKFAQIPCKENSKVLDNRRVRYILRNPIYIGKVRYSGEVRAISKRKYDDENIITVDGTHEPIISIDLWEKVQARLDMETKSHARYSRREQSIEFMLKGLVRCSACNSTLVMTAAQPKSNGSRSLQCHRYARGSCPISHSITLKKLNSAVIEALEHAVSLKQFHILPTSKSTPDTDDADIAKMIAAEERKLERAKQAYLAEIDTIEQYAANKATISARIQALKKQLKQIPIKSTDLDAFAQKVLSVVEFIKRSDVTEKAKNETLRTIINKIVFNKTEQNIQVYFKE